MRLILTRHGETEENKKGISQGHLPGKLSKEGIEQAQKLAIRLKDEEFNAIYSSDLARAADTTKIIAKYHDAPIFYIRELREFDIGNFSGKPKHAIDWNNLPINAESRESGEKRLQDLLVKVYKKYPNGTVLFVSHGGIGSVFIRMLFPEDHLIDFYKYKNTAVNIFEVKENIHELKVLNCTEHLLPAREECLQWYKDLDTPDNIIEHVLLVNKIAVFLGKYFKIDIQLLDRVALLHDLDKWSCIINPKLKHGFETERILKEKGYPELGYYARQHRGDLITKGLETWIEKIISYADKRVLGNKIVSLKKRFEYINEKYPTDNKKQREKEIKLFYELEKEIFSNLDIKPEKLKKLFNSYI